MASKEFNKTMELSIMEKKYATELSESVEGLKNIVVRETLKGIAHDSRKHAGFYHAILSLLEDVNPALEEADYNYLEEAVKKHIEVEKRMMEEAEQLLKTAHDSRIKHLLKEIYDDEVKHHELMKRILEGIVRREAIFEADWWDAIWRDVPGHGAPI